MRASSPSSGADPAAAVERALLATYLQFRTGVLAQGLGRLVFDRKVYRRPGVVAATLGVTAFESVWLARRARARPLNHDRAAVAVDIAVAAVCQVVAAEVCTNDGAAAGNAFADHNAVWATVAAAGWLPDWPVGVAATGGLWATSCAVVWRTRRLTRPRALQELSFYAGFYLVARVLVGLLRRYVAMTLDAEERAVSSARERARLETRARLHATVHERTLGVLRAIREQDPSSEKARRLAAREASHLRGVLRGDDDVDEPASIFDTWVEESAARGLRLEVIDDTGAPISLSVSAALGRTLFPVFDCCLTAGVRSALLRVTRAHGVVTATFRTRVPVLDRDDELLIPVAVAAHVEVEHRSSRRHGTRLTVRVPESQ